MFYLYYLCFVMQKSTLSPQCDLVSCDFVFIIINCAPCTFNCSRPGIGLMLCKLQNTRYKMHTKVVNIKIKDRISS